MRAKFIHNLIDRRLPLRQEEAANYRMVSGFSIVAGAFTADETLAWVERGSHIVDPATAVGVLATAGATSLASFMWHRANRAETGT